MSTRELATAVIEAKGFDADDRHMRTSIAYRIIQVLRMQEKRCGPIKRMGKLVNVVVWSANPS